MPPKTDFDFLKDQLDDHEEKDDARHLETLQVLAVLKEKISGIESQLSLIADRGFKIFCVVLAVALLGGPLASSIFERFIPAVGAATEGK